MYLNEDMKFLGGLLTFINHVNHHSYYEQLHINLLLDINRLVNYITFSFFILALR